MTSKQTDPDLEVCPKTVCLAHVFFLFFSSLALFSGGRVRLTLSLPPLPGIDRSTYSSSMLGWKMRFTKPMLGDL